MAVSAVVGLYFGICQFFVSPYFFPQHTMSALNDQLKSFKKSFKANADIAVKRAGQAAPVKETKSTIGTIANNTKASFESGHDKKRKRSTGKLAQAR